MKNLKNLLITGLTETILLANSFLSVDCTSAKQNIFSRFMPTAQQRSDKLADLTFEKGVHDSDELCKNEHGELTGEICGVIYKLDVNSRDVIYVEVNRRSSKLEDPSYMFIVSQNGVTYMDIEIDGKLDFIQWGRGQGSDALNESDYKKYLELIEQVLQIYNKE